ncbi:MAG: hypothetical protein H7210_10755 [Pyrinomonadaceae bacterium]|nr:hypothetical protein [Phycisphaerales bacterium]
MARGLNVGVAVLGLSLCVPFVASGRVLYEGFGYQAGAPLAGQNGGAGPWVTPWMSSPPFVSPTIDVPGLSYSHNAELLTTPGAARSDAAAFGLSMNRLFTPDHGTNGTSLWISFLAQIDTPTSGNAYVLLAFPGGPPNVPGIAISITRFGFNDTFLRAALAPYAGGGSGGVAATTPIAFGETALLVARIDYRAGPDLVSLWLNPGLDVLPGTADITLNTLDLNVAPPSQLLRFEQGNNRASFIDEIRLGGTFEEVTPLVPGPSAISVVLIGGMWAARRRRVAR